MDISNPLAPSLAQSVTVERQQSTDKSAQIRRAQALRKNATATGSDVFEHQVESCEEDTPIHDDHQKKEPKGRKRKPNPNANPSPDGTDGEAPHLDLTA